MEFGKDHKVLIESMNVDEASAFVKFLRSEITRHFDDIIDARELMREVIERFKL